jgi:hypothetical protein
MRYSLLVPLALMLGMAGCIVPDEPAYSTGYVAYGPAYDVYYSDGYYWGFYDNSWYWWSHDRWVYSPYRPHAPVIVTNGHGPRSTVGMTVRDHRGDRPAYRANRQSNWGGRPSRGWRSAPVRSAPSRVIIRNHRR